jgi:uncharacterized protein (DUF488 family)
VLRRQATILALLDQAGRPITQTILVKLAFLLRQETLLGNDRTFYWFVPYRYGPFSFALYRELASLERYGFIERSGKRTSLAPALREEALERVAALSPTVRRAVRMVVAQYGRTSQQTLLRQVYERYPWYASKSKLTELARPAQSGIAPAPTAVYTVGYEGKSVDQFFDQLLRTGIATILDVRANPISRKYGFARRSMGDIASKLGLAYQHWPSLGIESARRRDLTDFASYQRLLARYEMETLPRRSEEVRAMAKVLERGPTALLCAERDSRYCHRGRLAEALAAETGLDVVHL